MVAVGEEDDGVCRVMSVGGVKDELHAGNTHLEAEGCLLGGISIRGRHNQACDRGC